VGNTSFRVERMAFRLAAGFRKKNHPVHKRKLMAKQLNPATLPLVSRRERNLNNQICLGFRNQDDQVASININGVVIEVDEESFIQDPDSWNEDVAKYLAQSENIGELSADHWKVIYFLREYYREYQIAPMIRTLCKETGFNLKHIYELFPSGPARGACKIAGLPKPAGCV